MNRWLLFFIGIAFLLRAVGLGSFPLGFHADEVRVGWNAYSILKTGKDDRGNKFALYYNTFGDYRPTGIFYLTIPSIVLFGLNPFAVRLPGALIGALTLIPLYFLTKELTKSKYVAYFSALFLALIPWHWIVSRATSEAIMSLFFGLCGLLFLLYGLRGNKNTHFVVSFLSFLASCLLYHAARPITPLFIIIPLLYFWKKTTPLARKKGIVLAVMACAFVGAMLLGKGSLSRYRQVAVSNDTNVLGVEISKPSVVMQIRDQYLDYLSFDYLIGNASRPYRYRVSGIPLMGTMLTLFFLAGIIAIIQKKAPILPLYLLLLSPLPAAVTAEDSPNLHRAIFMLPFLLVIAGSGAVYLAKGSFKAKLGFLSISTLFVLTTMSGIMNYFGAGSTDAAPYRDVAAYELIQQITQKQNNYDHVIITNKPDSPYPWYAFYNHLDPAEFNAHAIKRTNRTWDYKNITFTDNECPAADSFDKKSPIKGFILVVDGLGCSKEAIMRDVKGATMVSEIFNTDGSVVYRLWEKAN